MTQTNSEPRVFGMDGKGSCRTWINVCLWAQSLFYGFGLLFATGVIPAWGQWYSCSPYYSAQANALLHGDLALSHSPLDLDEDLAWSEGGVHQVWGLGVPCLRLPFVMLSHLFGQNVFPGHLVTGFFLSCVAYLLLATLIKGAITRRSSLFAALPSVGCMFIILLFPPYLALLSTTAFNVYEEAAAYTYAYGIAEAVLLLRLFQRPTRFRWVTLMLVAGCGAFVRPTLIFYGAATWLLGIYAFISQSRPGTNSYGRECGTQRFQTYCPGASQQEPQLKPRKATGFSSFFSWFTCDFRVYTWAAGSFLFTLGILLLMLTNWMRFGSPTEFGHKLNVQNTKYEVSLCATRFSHPFEREPFPVVVKELVGTMFFQKPLRLEENWCRPDRFWGLADVPRIRKQYFRAYDWTYIPLLTSATILVGFWVWRSFRGGLHPRDTLLMKMGTWCLISLGPMFWFYLRTPAFTTRYLLDFAPGFAVLMAIAWFAAVSQLRDCWRVVCILALGAWMGCEIVVAQKFGQSPFSFSWPQVVAIRGWADARSPAQPIHIGNETTSSVRSGIPYDGTGWISSTGRVLPYVNVFVEDARFLELELARAPETDADPDPLWVKAKIGLEFLERESVVRTDDTWRIRFKGPRRASYRTGIQSAFIIFVPDTHMADKRTPWILRRVRWQDPVHSEANQTISSP